MTARAPLKAGSQCSRILAQLARGGSVTSLEAFRRWNVTSLHRRLEELRERGHAIDHGTYFTTRNGVRVKRYRLERH
jgi:DNA-binding IclR family transcriptional regulator